MFQLRRLNDVLVTAGQAGNMNRAAEVRGTPPVAFAPLDASQLDRRLDRGYAIAAAVDRRYTVASTLLDAVADLDPDLRDSIAGALEGGTGHAAELTSFREPLDGRPPAEYLRPVHAPASDDETTLQSVSQREYRLIVGLLAEHFAGLNGLTLLALARDAMRTLGDSLLAERDLLPLFD
jgi:hypothetical protein